MALELAWREVGEGAVVVDEGLEDSLGDLEGRGQQELVEMGFHEVGAPVADGGAEQFGVEAMRREHLVVLCDGGEEGE